MNGRPITLLVVGLVAPVRSATDASARGLRTLAGVDDGGLFDALPAATSWWRR